MKSHAKTWKIAENEKRVEHFPHPCFVKAACHLLLSNHLDTCGHAVSMSIKNQKCNILYKALLAQMFSSDMTISWPFRGGITKKDDRFGNFSCGQSSNPSL